MNIEDVLYDPAQELVYIGKNGLHLRPAPLRCDSFVARSAMQKAIRRGAPGLALRAAATLMLTNGAVVWRRLLVTALEDLGIHETGILIRIAAAIERRRFGIAIKDEWPLIEALIRECCSATRCQAANDLHNLSIHDVRYDAFRSSTADLPVRDLSLLVADKRRDLIERNIAVLSCLGVEHAPWSKQQPTVNPEELAAVICPNAHPAIRAIYAWAFRKTRLPLATSALLLTCANGAGCSTPPAFDDDVPPIKLIDSIPTFALDQYTRLGRTAIRYFTKRSERWEDFADKLALCSAQQFKAAGELLFRVEGAVVTRRCSWGVGRALFEQSSTVGCYLPMEAVDEGRAIVRSELPLLDELRAARLSEAQLALG